MDELTLDGKNYLSSKRAAQVTGYAKDYVGQLCREGRVAARLVGRNWYVLESSILEHRFGAEEQKEPVPASLPEPTAWESPVYSAEPPQLIPELRPKPLETMSVAPAAPLADMQSAWKEWFATQANEEKRLPDASNMLLETEDEAEPVEELPQETPEPLKAPQVVEEEQIVPIHIERHEEPLVTHQEEREEARLEPIVIHRSQVTLAPVLENTYRRGALKQKRAASSHVASKALLLGVMGIAVAVAVVGSGAADRYLESTFGSAFAPVTSFIGGVQNISK